MVVRVGVNEAFCRDTARLGTGGPELYENFHAVDRLLEALGVRPDARRRAGLKAPLLDAAARGIPRDLFPGGLRPPAAWAPEELERA